MTAPRIDRSRFFLPEHLTPLFYTPVYRELGVDERRAYNQLHGLYFNEQFLFFESTLPAAMIAPLLADPRLAALAGDLERYIADETEHGGWFRALNRACAPDLYARADFRFIRVSPLVRRLWTAAPRRLDWFPWVLWLAMIQEEKATWYAREFLRQEGELEPGFVAVQRRHLESEGAHEGYAAALLERFWDRANGRVRRLNARIFAWVLREFFTVPRRSGLRVVAAWFDRSPALEPRLPLIREQLLALGGDPAYLRSHYGPHVVPRTLARLRRHAEFDGLSAYFSNLARPRRASEAGA